MALVFGIITYSIMHHIQKKKNRITKIKHIREKTRIETELQFFFSLAQEIQTPIMLINNPANEIANSENLPENIVQKFPSSKTVLKSCPILQMKFLTLKNKYGSKSLSCTYNRFNKADCQHFQSQQFLSRRGYCIH